MELTQLIAQHKDTLDRLYGAWDKAITSQEIDTAFKAIDSYLETHKLSLATVSEIRLHDDPLTEEDFLDLA